jgi:Pyridine nucleotide-disulphide oxidoreductase
VLAIGLRGSPMKLGCPGEDMDKVTYRMIEPEQYHGQRVLIVGGGDSAVEAAIQLAEESTAKVSISYRQTAFTKAKKRNREKIEQLIAAGKVRALLGTKVLEIQPEMVRIGVAGDDKKDDKKGSGKGDDKKVDIKRDETQKPAPRDEARSHGDSKITLRPDTKLLPLDDSSEGGGKGWPATRAAALHGEASSDEEARASKGARRPEELQRTMFISDEMKAEAQKGFTPDEPSSISIRGGVRALDDLPSKSAAPGDFSGIVRIPAQKDRPKDKPRTSAGKRIQSVVSNLRARTRVIVGGRAANIEDLDDLSGLTPRAADSGPAPKTTIGVDEVKKEGEGRLKNDVVIVCIGGQLPTAFLNSIKVTTKRYAGDEKAASGGKGLTKAQVEARSRRRLAMTLFALGGSIIIGLLLIGQEYYWLPVEDRVESPLHPLLKPSGLWGHGVGVAATTFMLANFIYAARKRWAFLKGTASIRTWLTFHMFVGIMSPLVIAFHAAFLAQNLLAVWTWVALSIVVATGVFGRFLFGLVPAQAGKLLQVTELRSEVADTSAVLSTKIAEAKDVQKATRIFNVAKNAPEGATLVRAMIKEREGRKKLAAEIEEARGLFKDQAAFETYRDGLMRINRARLQISFYAALKRVFRAWLIIHVVISIFMVFLIGAHVAVTAYLGFRWIFGEGN